MIRPEETTTDRIYDRCAASYGHDVSSNLSARLKYEMVIKYLKPGDNVLDVGCANGIYMRLLAGRCRSITGIDINEAMLGAARQTLAEEGIANARLERRSAADMGFPEASFDLVYSFSTLLLVPDIGRALHEISRVLHPGSIAVLDFAGRKNLSRIYWGMYYRRHGHFGLHSFNYREITGRLEAQGLEVIESHALGFMDQWHYIPVLHWCKWLDRWLHAPAERDLDYRVSNLPFFFPLANRWYIVCRKRI
jgi:ubiquinone/menaquinone biosynthesis C-methylase UbiE